VPRGLANRLNSKRTVLPLRKGVKDGARPISEEVRDALFEHHHFVLHSGGSRFFLEQLERFFDGLMRQAEGSVVHGDHPAGLQIEKGFGGIGGAGVDVTELLGVVGADREQRDLRRQAASDFAETGEVGSVSGVVEGVFTAAQHIASVTTMRIFQNARSPMARRNVGNIKRAVAIGVPPLQFDNFFEAEIGDEVE
jgi:hypothetical protein